MILSEAHARRTRCCGPEGTGREYGASMAKKIFGSNGEPGRYCIGSKCMAWCFVEARVHDDDAGKETRVQTQFGRCGLTRNGG